MALRRLPLPPAEVQPTEHDFTIPPARFDPPMFCESCGAQAWCTSSDPLCDGCGGGIGLTMQSEVAPKICDCCGTSHWTAHEEACLNCDHGVLRYPEVDDPEEDGAGRPDLVQLIEALLDGFDDFDVSDAVRLEVALDSIHRRVFQRPLSTTPARAEGFRTKFVVPTDPKGKGRPQFARHKHGPGVSARTPAATANFESKVMLAAAPYAPSPPLDAPLRVTILCFFKRPGRLKARKHADGPIRMTSRPDADNVAKAVLDAMEAWWADDARVCELRVEKWYHGREASPRVEVEVEELEA